MWEETRWGQGGSSFTHWEAKKLKISSRERELVLISSLSPSLLLSDVLLCKEIFF